MASFVLALWVAWPGEPEPLAGQPGATGGSAASGAVTGASAAAITSQPWAIWSVEAVDAARASGRPVFVDFTAAWCVSCQANKKLVLERATVSEALQAGGVVTFRADWTRQDPAITAELARHGRSGVPLYLLYDPRALEPAILPELLSTGIVLDALAALR